MGALGRVAFHLRIAAHIALASVKVSVLFPVWSQERRRAEIKAWSRRALTILGFRPVVVAGEAAAAGRPHLIVSNHVSWIDVVAILSETHAVFVAKSEVRRWPLIGSIAERIGTIFVQRRCRREIASEVRTVAARLADGAAVGLFPEGTTTEGADVLPFRPLYFEAAILARMPVQPVAIRYLHDDGTPAEEAAFTGETSLLQSFGRLANGRARTVELTYLPLIEVSSASRREVAQQAEGVIRAALAGPRGRRVSRVGPALCEAA